MVNYNCNYYFFKLPFVIKILRVKSLKCYYFYYFLVSWDKPSRHNTKTLEKDLIRNCNSWLAVGIITFKAERLKVKTRLTWTSNDQKVATELTATLESKELSAA